MATIGNIVIGMSAKTESLRKDLNEGANIVTRFAKTVGTATMSAVAGFGQIASAAGSAAAVGIGALALKSAKMVDDAGDMADRLGTTTSSLLALRYAAKLTGSETESLDGALAKMTVNLGKAAAEGGPTGDTLSSIGLKAGDLARMDASKAFATIAGELSKIDNPARRAALAMEIFGKGGVGVLGTINAGGDEIGRLTAEFETFGAVSEAQRQGIGKLFDAFDRIGAVIAGVGARIASELSPYLTAAAEYFVGLASSGTNMGKVVAQSVGVIVESIAVALDVIDTLRLGFLVAQKAITQGFEWIVWGALKASQAFDAMWGAVTGNGAASAATQTLQAVADELARTTKTQGDALVASASKASYGDQARAAMAEIASKADAAAKAVDQTPKAFAAIEAAADGAEKATSKAFDAMKSDAERFVEAAMTPLEKFEAEQKRLKELAGAGLLDQTTVNRITTKGLDTLNQDQAKASDSAAKNPFANAMEFGSQEARSTILRAADSTRADDAGKKTADNTSRLVDLQTKAVSVLDQLSRSLVSSGAAEVF